MTRTMAALMGGVLLGILAMFAVARFGAPSVLLSDELFRDIADVPKMAQEVAEKHRDEQFASLTSVEALIALPTEFARSEAMYALASRSNSDGVQNLIFEATRIADEVERARLLGILFFRLAEIDPHSALALARTDYFNAMTSIERTVWYAWARKDLEDALFVASTQISIAHQKSAAQSLYAAFGFMGNETTERIEAELGIGPDRSTRGRYLYSLADKSPADAIAFINGLEYGKEQQEYVSWLAYYVSSRDPGAALPYADLFTIATYRKQYKNVINDNIARANPRAIIDRWLESGHSDPFSSEFHSAVSALTSTDVDAAKQYFELARSNDDRRTLGSAIAVELAKKDPVDALAWARANETKNSPILQRSVLLYIAQSDPQLALAKALETPNAQMRSNLVSNVVQHIAQNDPVAAVAHLDQIPDGQQKIESSQYLVSWWARTDPDAAIDWVFSQDKDTAGQMAQVVANRLLRDDIDAAIRLLPRMDEGNQESLRLQIAQRLAASGPPGEAQYFIQQFEGKPGYDQLQASLISGLAETDPPMAKQLADQLADGAARDRAYVQVISQHAQTNPIEATRWLSSVSDENLRGAATGQLAQQWYQYDPSAASRWVADLPAGSSRDDAIVQVSSQWRKSSVEQEQLIASIEDRDKRSQAKLRRIYNLMHTNPAKARKLLMDEDISSVQRQRAENVFRR